LCVGGIFLKLIAVGFGSYSLDLKVSHLVKYKLIYLVQLFTSD